METILVLTDFSRSAAVAADAAVILAEKLEANILLLHTTLPRLEAEDSKTSISNEYTTLSNEAERLKHRVNAHNHHGFKPAVSAMQATGTLSAKVEAVIKETPIILIVMGSRSKSNDDSFYGSDIYAVINKATCPVLVIPEIKGTFKLRDLVFLTDMPTADIRAFEYLARLARLLAFNVLISPITEQVMVMDLLEADEPACFTCNLSRLNNSAACLANLQGINFSKELEMVDRPVNVDVIAMVHKKHYLYWRLFNEVHSKVLGQHNKASFLILPEA